MINFKIIADLLFPKLIFTRKRYEQLYKRRKLLKNQIITRFAPNTSGNFHLGFLYMAYVAICAAKYSNGICLLRIDDTDKRRENTESLQTITRTFSKLGINFEEGYGAGGDYGPYIQSERKGIYEAYAYDLLTKGYAYPCFCTQQTIDEKTQEQRSRKVNIGYYGEWAKCRSLSPNEIENKIKNKEPFAIRLKSFGNRSNRVMVNDILVGKIKLEENDSDIIILKSDGLPTYHFAVVVDDFLMKITHIIRSSSGLSSTPIQYQIAEYLDIPKPKYLHLGALMIIDGNSKRKLSRNKDKESDAKEFSRMGIPNELLLMYLLSLANNDFAEWFKTKNSNDVSDFPFSINKCSSNGVLFSFNDLRLIGKEYFHNLLSEDIYNMLLAYAKQYDRDFYKIIVANKLLTISVLNSGKYDDKPRKDISCLQDFKRTYSYMYDRLYYKNFIIASLQNNIDLVERYITDCYDDTVDKNTWLTNTNKWCTIDNNRTSFKDLCQEIMKIVAGTTKTIDLYYMMRLITKQKLVKRIKFYKKTVMQQKTKKVS
jgi:glutamyl-tRNA synthetase